MKWQNEMRGVITDKISRCGRFKIADEGRWYVLIDLRGAMLERVGHFNSIRDAQRQAARCALAGN